MVEIATVFPRSDLIPGQEEGRMVGGIDMREGGAKRAVRTKYANPADKRMGDRARMGKQSPESRRRRYASSAPGR